MLLVSFELMHKNNLLSYCIPDLCSFNIYCIMFNTVSETDLISLKVFIHIEVSLPVVLASEISIIDL